jgi:release factor glutamine methyltransferase
MDYNIDNAKFETELILCSLLQCDKIDLYTKNQKISQKDCLIIESYIKRRIAGEPIQYILKNSYFYGRGFFVNENVLIPRFDSELIIDIAKKYGCVDNILDVGTGSGNLAITIAAENLAKNIVATDISKQIIKVAEYNKKKLCPEKNINFIIDDFLNSTINQQFDMIISNPPYIPKNEINKLDDIVKKYEPIKALTDGKDGYNFYKKFSVVGKKILKNNGVMLLEIGINNKINELKKIFCNYTIEIFKDLNDIPRVIKIY